MRSLDGVVCSPFRLSPPVVVDQQPDFLFVAIVVVTVVAIADFFDSKGRVDCWSAVLAVCFVVAVVAIVQATMAPITCIRFIWC